MKSVKVGLRDMVQKVMVVFAMTKPAINMRAIRIATSFFIETPP